MVKKAKAGGSIGYSYIRWSRAEQADGDTLRRQLELTRDWCARSGVRLDESLRLVDAGASAFHGGHRDDPDKHALALFVQMARDGRVRPDSYLVIENLDRLSREHVRAAVKLFLDLLDLRVNIVTTAPERVFRHDTQDMTDIIIAVVELSRGHSESARRSERCGRAWSELKRKAAAEKKPITRVVPAWVEVRDDGFELVPWKADAVRRIYGLAREGFGIDAIVKKLNREGVKPISEGKLRGRHWVPSYVAHILKSRAAVGEYHPHKGAWSKEKPKARVPDGDPIPGFFPAVVTDDEWHATRAAVESRRKAVGQRGHTVNVFLNLLFDARTGGPMHMLGHRGRGRGAGARGTPVLFPAAFRLGKSPFCSFPLGVFEQAFFGQLRELDPRSILPADRSGDEVLALSGRVADLERRIGVIQGKLATDAEGLEPLIDVLRRLEVDRRAAAEQLAEARQRAASPLAEAWGQARSLLETLAAAPDQAEARTRLRAALRRITSDVRMLVVRRAPLAVCAAQVFFTGTDRSRTYLIAYTPPRSIPGRPTRPASWDVWHSAEAGIPGDIDLRDPKNVKKMEKEIAAWGAGLRPAAGRKVK
ncbi:MAG: hypothetical protein C0501_17450 [Isosphaera sp.]|nr:hypothetical protein [Isosphaera sp.]